MLSPEQARCILSNLDGSPWLVANLLYGCGLRPVEGLRLRVKDLELERGELIVRDGKGAKDRVTVLPQTLHGPLKAHLARLHEWFTEERKRGRPGVSLPNALSRKYPRASTLWGWQYLFPSSGVCRDPYDGGLVRHHIHPKTIQRRVTVAVRRAGIDKPVGCHTFRHCFCDPPARLGLNLDGPPSRYVPPSVAESRRDHVQPYASGRFRPRADAHQPFGGLPVKIAS